MANSSATPNRVAEGESRWLIERTYAKGQPAERREFWLGITTGDVSDDSFGSAIGVWTTDAIEAARFSSRKIAQTLRYRHFHPEAPVEECEHLFQCGISSESRANNDTDTLIRLIELLKAMDMQAEKIIRTEGAEEIIVGYRFNTGCWHRILGTIAGHDASKWLQTPEGRARVKEAVERAQATIEELRGNRPSWDEIKDKRFTV